jgi:HEAT repeat protein
MSLPLPRYTRVGLDAYLATAPLILPLPPGEPASWTCLLNVLGTAPLLYKDDAGMGRVCDADLLRALLKQLGRPSADEEQEAFLLCSPIPGADAEGGLIGLLRHETYGVRQRAALTLGYMGGPAAIRPLMGNLDDSDNDARRGAAEALGRLRAVEAIDSLLIRPWDDSDQSVNAARVEALIRIDSWDRVADSVSGASAGEHKTLVQAMLEARDGETGPLVEVMSEGDENIRRVVGRFLAAHPAAAAACIEALVEQLGSEGDDEAASMLAAAAGAAGEEGVDLLIERLESSDWRPRMYACAGLAWAGETAVAAEAALIDRMENDDDADVKREAALALARIGKSSAKVEGLLSSGGTSSYCWPNRAIALGGGIEALAGTQAVAGKSPPGRNLLPILGTAGDARTRALSALLVALVEPDLAAPLLEALARDDARDVPLEVRRACAGGLMLTGHAPRRLGAVHRLLLCHAGDTSRAPRSDVRRLKGLGGQLVTVAAKDGDWPLRIDALRLLQLLGEESDPFVDLIRHVSIHDPDVDCRKAAAAMQPTEWEAPSPAQGLADALVPPRGSSDDAARTRALSNLASMDAELARPIARRLMIGDNRAIARAASRLVGADTRDAATIGSAVARLADDGWVVREAACDLLGALDVGVVDAGLIEEVVEALRARIDEDHDDDVKNAAKAALASLGHPWSESESDDEDDE